MDPVQMQMKNLRKHMGQIWGCVQGFGGYGSHSIQNEPVWFLGKLKGVFGRTNGSQANKNGAFGKFKAA